MHQEIHYQLLTLLTADPDSSQRQLAQQLAISLGKVNYCLKALVDAGMIAPEYPPASRAGKTPRGPMRYRVTRRGCRSRVDAAAACLQQKSEQLEILTREIETLKREVDRSGETSGVKRDII